MITPKGLRPLLAALALWLPGCGAMGGADPPLPPMSGMMRGMTEAGYKPGVFATQQVTGELARLKRNGVDWLAIQVAWFQDTNRSVTIGPSARFTPTDASVRALVALAHRMGMRVFLNPFVNSLEGNGWQANFAPSSPAKWFSSFDAYLRHYAQLAQSTNADLFAIGDEFDSLDDVPAYRPYWLKAISVARRYYRGPIVYGADYTHYQQVTFWQALDDVGIDAYFPLSQAPDPSVADLSASWRQIALEIAAWRKSTGLDRKGFIITELGYPSEDGAAAQPGAWLPQQPVNLALQQRLYQATLTTIGKEPWLRGLFWFWWANPSNPDWQGGPNDNGYTPRGKPAEATLRQYFGGSGRVRLSLDSHAFPALGSTGHRTWIAGETDSRHQSCSGRSSWTTHLLPSGSSIVTQRPQGASSILAASTASPRRPISATACAMSGTDSTVPCTLPGRISGNHVTRVIAGPPPGGRSITQRMPSPNGLSMMTWKPSTPA